MKNASEFIEKGAFTTDLSGAVSSISVAGISGLTVCTLNEAFTTHDNLITSQFPNADRSAKGVFVGIDGGTHIDQPVYVTVSGGTTIDTCLIAVGKSASATIIFLVEGGDITRSISVEAGAEITLRDIVVANETTSLNSLMCMAEKSRAKIVTVECGIAQTQLVYCEQLVGVEAHTEHYGIFMAADGENKGVNVRVEHLVANCTSNVLIKGVAAGMGRGSFKGMVYVAKDAQHTEAYQQSRNIIIGGQARILASPQLEIYADDVRCSHGATVGQMNDDAIYYMQQRGLSDAEARGLQLTGFVNDITSRLGEGYLADNVYAAASAKIEQL